jgi:hypothetical protein
LGSREKAVLLDFFTQCIGKFGQYLDVNRNPLNDLNSHRFDVAFLWLDPEMRMGKWDTHTKAVLSPRTLMIGRQKPLSIRMSVD